MIQGKAAFEIYVPVYRGNEHLGTFGGVYAVKNILAHALPPRLAERYRIGISGPGVEFAALDNAMKLGEGLPVQVPLDPPGFGTKLTFAAYQTGATWTLTWLSAIVLALALGMAAAIWLLARDVRRRRAAEAALSAEKEQAEVTLHSIGDAVITTDARGVVQYVNPEAQRLTGWTLEEAIGQPITVVFSAVSESDRSPTQSPVVRCINEGKVVDLGNHPIMIGRHGQEYSIQDSAAPIWGPNDALQGVVLVFSDVSESRRLANEATHQATHDPLTGLVDRREFEKRLQRILETAKTDRSEHVVCYADLDQFKVINDTCGHVAGDEFLRQLSDALLGQARKRDTFARLGGDEFGVLMEHCAIEQGKRAAETLREVIESFLFVWEGKSFKIGASMGLVAITAASESTSDVMRQADSACYAAKDAGRHRVHIYRDDDTRLAERLGEMQWVARIQRALDESRFELYYQTIKALNPDEATGVCYEVFIRMEDEDGRIVLPGAFLPAAERYKLATKVDRWVVNQTFRWLVDHPEHQETLELVR